MTGEHVIPGFIYAYQKQHGGILGWNEKAQKKLPSEQRIKDVCKNCNNGVLSELDAYAKSFFDANELFVQIFRRRNFLLEFDFHKLLRWQLKVSYNSARTEGSRVDIYEKFLEYILTGKCAPRKYEFAIVLQLLKGVEVPNDQRQGLSADFPLDSTGYCNPFLVRLSRVERWPNCGYVLRANVFGPLVFYLMFFEKGILPGHAAVAKREFLGSAKNLCEIKETQRVQQMTQSDISWLEMYHPQLLLQGGF